MQTIMRSLLVGLCLVFSPALVHADPTPEQRDAVVRSYRALTPEQIEAKKLGSAPFGTTFTRIDVSERIRSTSFGHATLLLVAPSVLEFYVEHGRSTNRPPAWFGPFLVQSK